MENNIIIGAITYILGLSTGFALRSLLDKYIDKSEHRQSVKEIAQIFLFIIVTSVWVVAIIISFTDPGREVSNWLHGMMGVVLGFFFKPISLDFLSKVGDAKK